MKQMDEKTGPDGATYYDYDCVDDDEINMDGTCTIANLPGTLAGKGALVAYWKLLPDEPNKKFCFGSRTSDSDCGLTRPEQVFIDVSHPSETVTFHTSCSRAVVGTLDHLDSGTGSSTTVTVAAAYTAGGPLQVCNNLEGCSKGKGGGGKGSGKGKGGGKIDAAAHCCVGTVSSLVVDLVTPPEFGDPSLVCTSSNYESSMSFFECDGFREWLYPTGGDNNSNQATTDWAGQNLRGEWRCDLFQREYSAAERVPKVRVPVSHPPITVFFAQASRRLPPQRVYAWPSPTSSRVNKVAFQLGWIIRMSGLIVYSITPH